MVAFARSSFLRRIPGKSPLAGSIFRLPSEIVTLPHLAPWRVGSVCRGFLSVSWELQRASGNRTSCHVSADPHENSNHVAEVETGFPPPCVRWSTAFGVLQMSFQLYSGGVLTAACGTNLDHGVLLVGYGVSEDGIKYWKVRLLFTLEYSDRRMLPGV